jgi:hypothetical protein
VRQQPPPDPERIAVLTEQAFALGQLKEQPGWAILTEIANRKIEQEAARITKSVLRGVPPTPQQCHYLNGCIETVKAILAHPEKAEQSLADALKKAERFQAITEEVSS